MRRVVRRQLHPPHSHPHALSDTHSTGRAYPDIAAQSEGFSIVVDLVPLLGGVGGTSCGECTVTALLLAAPAGVVWTRPQAHTRTCASLPVMRSYSHLGRNLLSP